MKQIINDLLAQALRELEQSSQIPPRLGVDIQVTPSKDPGQGDFASNVALVLAKPAGMPPRELAAAIVGRLAACDSIDRVEIAGPGFINFFVASALSQSVINRILEQGDRFGGSAQGAGVKVQVEFVSANPTGPLHVGHGRGAAYGATLANLLAFVGYEVQKEYYVNDAGRQMHILGTSTWLRYLELCGETIDFPSNGYQGDYVWDIAATLHREQGERFRKPAAQAFADVCADFPQGDKERHVDDLIANAHGLLGEDEYRVVFDLALDTLVDVIRNDLHAFGVDFDCWFSERSLGDEGLIEQAITRLQDNGYVYEEGGALWFRSTDFGDEKDRVVRRDNGQTTYFASDIAYHMNKFERGFDKVINIWGADHHGYIPRVKASLSALGYVADNLEVQLVQFANLFENGEKIAMSTRSGEFVTLRQLREDVGLDAARFFYVMRKAEQHMDFDLDLAREQSSDNPVYYLQYAHARICSVRRQCAEKGIEVSTQTANLLRLDNEHEQALIKQLSLFPERVESAANRREPHLVVNYLRELANHFHSWYNAHQFIVGDTELRDARIALAAAVAQVLRNGLNLMGVSAPEKM
ncbi:MAG: arginine--tRNA ligase [Gammaproteobacteria bacterium]|nr:arginine--tRNA ligase [Gammaproteobacteria bacterium]MDH3534138.1 arginine--tRNA ligase [Gammaproteobacteria bacterium]